MKNRSLLTLSTLVCVFMLFIGCKSDDVSPIAEIAIISGNNQTAVQGEYITEPVVIKVTSGLPANQIAIHGGYLRNNKFVTDNYDTEARAYMLDENYEARVYFSLDCEPGEQTISIAIMDASCVIDQECNEIASVEVTATAIASSSEWARICDFPSVRDIVNNNGFAFSYYNPIFSSDKSQILKSGDYMNWSVVAEFEDQIVDLEMLSDGTMLLITSDGVFKSTDGANWDTLSNPEIVENNFLYPSQLLAEDSVLFVNYSEMDQTNYANWARSRDAGNSWELLTTPLEDYPIIRAENGDLFGRSTEFEEVIYRSSDSGNTWESLVFSGSIEGSIQKIIADENSNLLILANQSDFLTNQISTKIYSLNSETLDLSEEPIPNEVSYISGIYSYNGILYFLSYQDIYAKSGSWQKIEGPQSTYPSIEGAFFSASFDYLHVKAAGQYIVSGYFANTYSNFIE